MAKATARDRHEVIVVDDTEYGPFYKVIRTNFIRENVLVGIVIANDVVQRLEWRFPELEIRDQAPGVQPSHRTARQGAGPDGG